jgi:hypothetical protein
MDLTPREFSEAVRFFFEKESQDFRHDWERTRWLGWMIVNSNPYLKNKVSSPDRLFKFTWEREEEESSLKEIIGDISTLDWDSLAIPPAS